MINPSARPIFAVCVTNDGHDDLSVGMLYRILDDTSASAEGLLRVVDDSGDDYLYSAGRFVIVTVSPAEEHRLLAVTSADVA